MFGLFKRRTEADEAGIPPEVSAAIEAAAVVFRAPGDDGEPRAVVQLPGLAGWLHGDRDAERLAKAFGLSAAQSQRAARHLTARVALAGRGELPQRSNWIHEW